ncbi:copper amine oxidase N-terminal domain-containing protein [Paenibacillus rhizophilus]|uniref:Copper amine oxidase N-terminal domain-containing protein n=1 Tax=Paenibacillus rhizophilus TaxID=1850366 RepID=A0A3N9P9P6_9BACL|nr:copper amine oxidase N-terminal domain-containing protein [Paenibacillus rhizophilus]RQW12210.1 copper amine oxidase N-terminal domain-containing protein [Paenibacillus rhizophilus]
MKKWFTMLGSLLLSLALAVPAFAAQAPITVYVDGVRLSFSAGSPYLQNGSVMVPFRAVFEKLGLKVGWDPVARSVTGTSTNLNLRLTIGSNRASVNSTVRKLPAAPVQTGGTAYVPLRFIGEATGGKVVWNPASRSVQITKPVSKNRDEEDIASLMNTLTSYFNSENAAGIASLAQTGSDFAQSVTGLERMFQAYDLKSEVKSMDILGLKDNEATIATVETSTRTGGTYIPDSQDEYIYTLVRSGSWKISDVRNQKSTVLFTREQGMQRAEMPQGTDNAIQNTLKRHYESLNDKNVTVMLSTMTSYGEDYDNTQKSSLEEFFKTYDLAYTLSASNVFYFNGTEAAVYVEQQVKDKNESVSYNQALILLLDKSDDGAWTISDSYTVSNSVEGEPNNP